MKIYVLYHGGGCADGFCSAWIARKVLPDATFMAVNYGDPPPALEKGADVYVLDFSYKRPVMEKWLLEERPACFTLIDHHGTAEKDLAGLDGWCRQNGIAAKVTFEMSMSGAMLTWLWFFRDATPPWIVEYVQDRDLWRWELPDSREINAALRSYPMTFGQWDNFAAAPSAILDSLQNEGEAILRDQAQTVEAAAKNAVEIEMDGHKILCVNATTLISETAGKLAEDRPFGATFLIRGDGKKVWSLRSREGGIDVSEVAKKRGGGGHRNAAGFQE
jgi:oligoribonuclease NrnB/cAMP/cGMP phosphodiesterase (DHH superfamily)